MSRIQKIKLQFPRQYAIIQLKFITFMKARMSSPAAETLLTPEEYLALERKATLKSEYLNGEIRAMPRVNFAHNLITVDVATELIVDSENKFTFFEIYVRVYDYGIFNRFTQTRA